MWRRYSLIGICFSLILILLDFYLLRKRKINGKGFVFWLITGTVIGVFSVIPHLLTLTYLIFGTQLPISSFMALGSLFFTFAIFYLYYKISELYSLLMKLTMEISVARHGQKQSNSDDQRNNENE